MPRHLRCRRRKPSRTAPCAWEASSIRAPRGLRRPRMRRMSAICPYMCTGTTARVRGPCGPRPGRIDGVVALGDVDHHGVAPAWLTASNVAMNVSGGTITSSPAPTPSAISARRSASSPLATATASHPAVVANIRSKLAIAGPRQRRRGDGVPTSASTRSATRRWRAADPLNGTVDWTVEAMTRGTPGLERHTRGACSGSHGQRDGMNVPPGSAAWQPAGGRGGQLGYGGAEVEARALAAMDGRTRSTWSGSRWPSRPAPRARSRRRLPTVPRGRRAHLRRLECSAPVDLSRMPIDRRPTRTAGRGRLPGGGELQRWQHLRPGTACGRFGGRLGAAVAGFWEVHDRGRDGGDAGRPASDELVAVDRCQVAVDHLSAAAPPAPRPRRQPAAGAGVAATGRRRNLKPPPTSRRHPRGVPPVTTTIGHARDDVGPGAASRAGSALFRDEWFIALRPQAQMSTAAGR